MNTNENIINDFASTLRNHRARSKVSLYSENQSQCKSGVEKFNIKEVLSSVANQLKAIQNADSVRKLPNERNIPDVVQKSHFLPVHNLIPLDQPPKQSHQFESQCVLDTQLINIIENAEAIIDVQKGMTQEFNTTFYHGDIENCNNSSVDINILKLTATSSNRAVDNEKIIVSKSNDLIQSTKDETHLKSHDYHKRIIEDIGNGMMQEFDTTFYPKDLQNAEENNDGNYFIENKNCYPDIIKEGEDNIQKVNLKDQDYGLNYTISEKQVSCAKNILTPTEENVTSDSTLTDLVLKKDMQQKDVCDFDKQSIFYFNTHEDDKNNCSQDEIITNSYVEGPTSPILNKIQSKIKSNTPSPLIFKLDSFEKFESTIMPIIETHDIETAKRFINSQILNKELFMYTHDEAVLSDRDKACTDAKYNSTQEDSIVISSDEESTLTCTVQNSFEHEPEISDEMMYVGFQTGNNRPIQISSDSYCKAKNIFENITNIDRENLSEFNVRNTGFDEYSRNKNESNLSLHEYPMPKGKRGSFSIEGNTKGEMNKLVTNTKVQDSIRINTDRLMDDTLLEEFNTDLVPDHKVNKSPIIEMTSKDNIAIAPIPDKAIIKTYTNKSTDNNSVGFKTANNKMIKVSVQALMETKNIVESLDKDDDCLPHKSEKRSFEKSRTRIPKTRSYPENIKSALLKDITKDTNFILLSPSTSFQNNANKIRVMWDNREGESQISKSSEIKANSMKKIPRLTHEIDPDYISQGFKTSSNKSLKISESASAKTKNVLHVMVQNNEVFNEKGDSAVQSFKGFTTASNKPVKISESALDKTKNILQDIIQNEEIFDNGGDTVVHSNNTFKGFTTASNKPVKVSESAFAKTKNIFQDIVQNEETHFDNSRDTVVYSSDNTFKGFTTASNKPVKLSESALAKSENIFQDIFQNEETFVSDSDTVVHSNNTFKGFTTASNKPVKISESAFAKTKTIFQDIVENETLVSDSDTVVHSSNNTFKGFTTARNKPVKISESALAKSKNMFQDIVQNEKLLIDSAIDTVVHSSNAFKGFTTASNKPVKISESALAKTKNIFQDIVENETLASDSETVVHSNNTFKGFTTASNKPVKMSKSAFAKTKNLFQDIAQNERTYFDNRRDTVVHSSNNTFKGFTTASNKPVKISESSLAKTKNIFQDIVQNEETFDNGGEIVVHDKVFKGFTTASNKPVKISKNALTKTKNILQDVIENVNNGIFPCTEHSGFTTVNKKLSLSEIQLEKCKDDYQNVFDNEAQKNEFNNLHNKIPAANYDDTKPQFQGFKTASNKCVKVSKEALFKTKNIFQDIDIENYKESKNVCDDLDSILNEKHRSKPVDVCTDSFKNTIKGLQDNQKYKENYNKDVKHDIVFKEQQPASTEATPNKSQSHIFQGFKTAGNKPIELSLDALAKSKKILENIDTDCKEQQTTLTSMEMKTQTEMVSKPHTFLGFNTANNKKVNVSGEALLKSRQLLQNRDLDLKNDSECFKDPNVSVSHILKKVLKKPTNTSNHLVESVKGNDDFTLDTDDIIRENDVFDFNTEVIKDFEATVYTEDFIKTETPKSKRSGSPILSCPKAKKKKFITPIKTSTFIAPINRKSSITFNATNIYEFNENYKISKKYTLKDINEMEKINNIKNVDPYVLNFKFETLLDFVFTGNRNDMDSDSWTKDQIIKTFTDSVNKRIIPDGWMENHLKLIIWKLLSYEIRFPLTMGDVCTVKNVLEQLKYRYKRELYNVERPALRKILEKDEVSTRRMILCVAGLFVDGVSLNSVKNQTQNIELLLTDGWYTVKACTDRMIDRLVCEGKISVGTKLVVHGAELLNCDQGISPWEDTSSVRLKTSGNATRRAKWDARLGFHGNGAILSRLSAIKPEGGKISRLRAFVTRVYPTLYIEKFPDGSTLTRSERLEHLYQMKYETERQMQMEKLYEELGRFSDQESQDSEGVEDGALDSGSQISRLMKRSRDLDEFRANLTGTQTRLLQEHAIKQNDKLIQVLQERFLELVKKRGLDVPRNVVPLMKIRVADVEPGGRSKAMITIWKPNETLQEMLTEGTWIDVYNVFPTSIRHSELQMSASRQSVFRRSKIDETDKLKALTCTLRRRCYPIKDLQNPSMNTEYNEIDTVGLIFLMEPQTKKFETTKQPFQNVYLTDENKNFICVNFWGGVEKFGFQNILDTGQVVTCVNLQKRAGNTRKNIPQYRATEFTYFTKTSKIDAVRKIADDLAAKFSTLDKRKFIEDCVALKNNYHNIKPGNTENVSPYRLNTSDYNVYKNKVFIDSPLVNKCVDANLNLTGLDFESTFKQTDTQDMSPQMLMRKRKVNEKIARLKMYGEPPPLSPMHLINKSSNAVKAFKSPFTNEVPKSVASPSVLPQNRVENNDDAHQNCRGSEDNVANLRALPQNGIECESSVTSSHNLPNKIDSSPVLGLNRTYVKRSSINPVKLNFSNAIDTSITDAFGEDFEYSPPLSLDANFIQ